MADESVPTASAQMLGIGIKRWVCRLLRSSRVRRRRRCRRQWSSLRVRLPRIRRRRRRAVVDRGGGDAVVARRTSPVGRSRVLQLGRRRRRRRRGDAFDNGDEFQKLSPKLKTGTHIWMMIFDYGIRWGKWLNWTRIYPSRVCASLPPHRNVEWCSGRTSATIATPSRRSDQCCVRLYRAVARSSSNSTTVVRRAIAHPIEPPSIERQWRAWRLPTLDGIPRHASQYRNDHFLDFRTNIRSSGWLLLDTQDAECVSRWDGKCRASSVVCRLDQSHVCDWIDRKSETGAPWTMSRGSRMNRDKAQCTISRPKLLMGKGAVCLGWVM